MQSKINSFFKPSSSSSSSLSASETSNRAPSDASRGQGDDLAVWERSRHVIVNKYERRSEIAYRSIDDEEYIEDPSKKQLSKKETAASSKNLNKKRSYAQFHLELGQSDFLLRHCAECGIKYAPGDELDEKNHRTFHKNHMHGIRFKGWQNERSFATHSFKGGRIIMIVEDDSPAHKNKVKEVVKTMEIELGEDWILHKSCKRIAGCLVAEPITEAFKLIPRLEDDKQRTSISRKKETSPSTTIPFGNIVLQREVSKRSRPSEDRSYYGAAIVCEEEAKPASCGVRAIWVSPSNRRKGIATQLLDTLRESFCHGRVLEKSQLAFSQPSSLGKAFAFSYFATSAFLVYKAGDSS
ncbi:PREDICTED: protein CHROMOSOME TRANSMISSION FIDELITY 7 isoform X2 [Tarenaya hassleriana]|uniref:protein CHROMOSOME TRANSMISSION FIDELITY 7 isoform X2 n=1 Tax=Tarenaya hassleriana TaxID=28532 RepID=UPI00053C543D|nr:PREDICTED: protein CHROMOSOME TRANSMISSION FIDELITY 7 isoform X2 [Tarenaya hassleriana]